MSCKGENLMEQRRSKRISQNLKVAFPCCNKLYAGTVSNLSENGMLIDSEISIPIKSRFEILIPISKEILKIPAIYMRLVKNGKNYNGMGVELLYPPQKYLEFVRQLHFDSDSSNRYSQNFEETKNTLCR
jgi:hypothetical protein